jgi:hypothetical protein
MYAVMFILGCEVVCCNIHLSWFWHDHFHFGFSHRAVRFECLKPATEKCNKTRKRLPSGAEVAAEKVVGSAEAFYACVEAAGLGWRAQPGMAVPREFSHRL